MSIYTIILINSEKNICHFPNNGIMDSYDVDVFQTIKYSFVEFKIILQFSSK